jgi:FkbM family methyltransferase
MDEFLPKSRTESVSMAFLQRHPEVQILIYGSQERALARKLAVAGVRCFSFVKDPQYKDVKFDPKYLDKHRDELEKLFALLADEESKLTLASVVKQRISSDHGYLRIADYEEYEHPMVKALPGDWVADCGAYDGATSLRFAKAVGKAGKVFAIEPDPANAEKINASIANQSPEDANVLVVNSAVSDIGGTLYFAEGHGGSSKLTPDGNIQVAVQTLDEFAATHNLTGSGLISLDVEGFEGQALMGGMELIKRLKPKLQISVYHKPHDLFSLPLWLHESIPGYTFFMGHHDSYHCETDIYAIHQCEHYEQA